MTGGSRIAVYAALGGNAAIAVLKLTVALLTGSAAMLAEGFHSIADTGNQALLLLGMRLGKRPPDQQHPFGHGMNVYFWAFVVSVMLFTLGGGFSIWEAVRTFLHGEHRGQDFTWAYVVLGGSAVFEGASLAFAIRSLLQEKPAGETFAQFWRESRDPTLMTVLLEDGAALVSLAVAASGLFLVQRTGAIVWDGVASAVIGSILLIVAVALAHENYTLLIGESAPPDVERRIREAAGRDAAVDRLDYVRTMHMGPDALLIVVGACFRRGLTTVEIGQAVQRVQREIIGEIGALASPHRTFVEPTTLP